MSGNATAMPLQSKVSLTLAILIAGFTLASYLILRAIVIPAFADIERAAAEADLKRAAMAIEADIENLEAVTADWAPWDDIYYYVRGQNPDFARSNLDRPTLVNLGLDFMTIYRADGSRAWGQLLVDGRETAIDELGLISPGDPAAARLTRHESPASATAGLVATRLGPMLISSRPILRSDSSGGVAGAMIMGEFLDDASLVRLRERTGVDLDWELHDDAAGSSPAAGVDLVVGEQSVTSHTVLNDIQGAPLLHLYTETPRRISLLGTKTVQAASLSLLFAGVLLTGAIWFMLRRTILRPIEKLAQHIDAIRTSGDFSRRLALSGNDEIGALARQFDDLTDEVHDARQALLDQSFKAGKADTAAEVLHNIRNAMTPMINGLERLGKSFTVARNLRVAEATEQLANPECPAERKLKFLQYIEASFKHITKVGDDALHDLRIATSQARQIEGILSDQEKFTNVAPVAENLIIDEVLGEAVHVIPRDAQPDIAIDLSGTLALYRVKAHRIGLLQVLSNLILNAYESIQRSRPEGGRISFDAAPASDDDRSMVRLTIRDNGSGFDAATCEKIFQRGFTSKVEGATTGLGLHWCANAVAGMGGRIAAESRGMGQGAEFHVLLPAAQGG
jgi:sensor domain CHASE-containing protein